MYLTGQAWRLLQLGNKFHLPYCFANARFVLKQREFKNIFKTIAPGLCYKCCCFFDVQIDWNY